tara:strand:- start:46 stop:1431 length:1386 start_codon:yes stop_codon:yes gene_type:complete
MKIKGKQSLSLANKLVMTTQIQFAIKLLQLNSTELQKEIDEKIVANPFLENDDSNNSTEVVVETPIIDQSFYSGKKENSVSQPYIELASNKESLHDYLLWQLKMSSMNNDDYFIAYNIIDYINDDGYLTEDVKDLFIVLKRDLEVTFQEIFAVLHKIQTFDPIGVGATSVNESLNIQLDYFYKKDGNYKLAKKIVNNLEKQLNKDLSNLDSILSDLKNNNTNYRGAIELIKSLNPKPGSMISTPLDQYHIVPDIIISKKDGKWITELNPSLNPKISINQSYRKLTKQVTNKNDLEYLRTNLQDAQFFLKALKNRNLTMLKVAKTIFKKQAKFLEKGDVAIQPLTLKNISELIGMHESTVSRCTNNKFVQTPRGTFELKYFFSSELHTGLGGMISSKAIKSMLEKIILNENKETPLSDLQIATSFSENGIKVARRTITKYREMLAIPTSNIRKKELKRNEFT